MISRSVPHSAPEGIEKLFFLLLGGAMLGIEIRFFRGALLSDLVRKVSTHGNHENQQICCPGGGRQASPKGTRKGGAWRHPGCSPQGLEKPFFWLLWGCVVGRRQDFFGTPFFVEKWSPRKSWKRADLLPRGGSKGVAKMSQKNDVGERPRQRPRGHRQIDFLASWERDVGHRNSFFSGGTFERLVAESEHPLEP